MSMLSVKIHFAYNSIINLMTTLNNMQEIFSSHLFRYVRENFMIPKKINDEY